MSMQYVLLDETEIPAGSSSHSRTGKLPILASLEVGQGLFVPGDPKKLVVSLGAMCSRLIKSGMDAKFIRRRGEREGLEGVYVKRVA